LYLLQNETSYYDFRIKNRELSFTVDASNLPCGLNGALYFVSMPMDGGMSMYPLDKAGAKFGTGYCDSQCPQDIKFINGEANIIDWTPSPNNPNTGTGFYGTCCFEMDVWEANMDSQAVTPHACQVFGQQRCSEKECGNGKGERFEGWCDKDGCDFNPYRLGNYTFYGPKMTVDTTQPITVVTRWVTTDGTDSGTLKDIQRFYVQNGRTIQQPRANIPGIAPTSIINDLYCNTEKKVFGDNNDFELFGGIPQMGKAMDQGMVLVLSLWDDYTDYMLWLDSYYPPTKPQTAPGVKRGTCATDSGIPSKVENEYPNSSVTYSNIRFGEIGSTIKI
jgi:cellulose 1,4-beta-cellobiosidase